MIFLCAERTPLALILAPTRDLAGQIYDFLNTYKTYLVSPTIEVCLLVGGTAANAQTNQIRKVIPFSLFAFAVVTHQHLSKIFASFH